MKKFLSIVLTTVMVFSLGAFAFAEEAAEAKKPIEISTAKELAEIANDLTADYVLTADIDLEGKEWLPIGTYAPSGESEEEQEIPHPDYAFTGTFDGNNHTIYNLVINQPEGWALGLFGCIADASVGNFALTAATVDGTVMCADVVGYSYNSTVYDVQLVAGSVTAHASEMSGEGMYGGIVGAGMNSLITGCSATYTNIKLPDGTANAGIIGGGLELTSVVDCTASGTVTAGSNCYGIGGISGCGFGAKEFTNCKAENVALTVGENSFWVGSITGYAGGFEDPAFGTPVTVFTSCTAENVTITRVTGAEDLVGGGFFNEEVAAAYGAPFDAPTIYVFAESAEAEEAAA